VDDDTAFGNGHGWIGIVCGADLVVIHDTIAVVHVPDLEAELVKAATAINLTVNGRQHEAQVVRAVSDGALAFVLRRGTRDDQPLLTGRMEVEFACFELELGDSIGHVRALLILGNKAEFRLASRGRAGHLSRPARPCISDVWFCSS